jgi:5'-deoxynucleotidase YfbR-like HD superfamily hydrolase
MINHKQIIDSLIDLQARYSLTTRTSSNWSRMQKLSQILPDQDIYELSLSRETLLEHVGHLPIITAYLHPLLERSQQVDLGHTLAILAIHDIAETVTGDIHSYDKSSTDQEYEVSVTKKLLNPDQFIYFEEYEAAQTLPAKFAKSVDKLAPMLVALSHPQLTKDAYQRHYITKDMVIAHKQKYMQWDKTINQLFIHLLDRLAPYFPDNQGSL